MELFEIILRRLVKQRYTSVPSEQRRSPCSPSPNEWRPSLHASAPRPSISGGPGPRQAHLRGSGVAGGPRCRPWRRKGRRSRSGGQWTARCTRSATTCLYVSGSWYPGTTSLTSAGSSCASSSCAALASSSRNRWVRVLKFLSFWSHTLLSFFLCFSKLLLYKGARALVQEVHGIVSGA